MDEVFVPVRGVVGAGDDDPADTFFQRELVDPLGHVDVAALVLVVASPPALHRLAWRAEVAEVDDGVAASEQWAKAFDTVLSKIRHLHAVDWLALAVSGPNVGQTNVVAVAENRQSCEAM